MCVVRCSILLHSFSLPSNCELLKSLASRFWLPREEQVDYIFGLIHLKLLNGDLASKPKTQLTCDAWISWDLQVQKLRLKDEMRVERRNKERKK
jgi:hypothetical protein